MNDFLEWYKAEETRLYENNASRCVNPPVYDKEDYYNSAVNDYYYNVSGDDKEYSSIVGQMDLISKKMEEITNNIIKEQREKINGKCEDFFGRKNKDALEDVYNELSTHSISNEDFLKIFLDKDMQDIFYPKVDEHLEYLEKEGLVDVVPVYSDIDYTQDNYGEDVCIKVENNLVRMNGYVIQHQKTNSADFATPCAKVLYQEENPGREFPTVFDREMPSLFNELRLRNERDESIDKLTDEQIRELSKVNSDFKNRIQELRIDYGNMYYENVDLKNQIAELQAQLKEQTLANKELNEQLDAVLEVSERFDKDIDVNLESGIDFNLDEELMDLDER